MTDVVKVPTDRTVVERVSTPTTVNAPLSSTVRVDRTANRTVVARSGTAERIQTSQTTVRQIAQGPQGPPGESEGATFIATAGETIHGGRAVRVVNGVAYHPSILNEEHADQVVGVAVQSTAVGLEFAVRTGGVYTELSAPWTGDGTVWCGDNGVLTQTPPTSGWLLQIGRVISTTSFNVDVDEPVLRN